MARAATTSDVFNAISEPTRRQIIVLLAGASARPVGFIVDKLGLPQPAVSKHLGVLRKVGVVVVFKQGQQRLYELNAKELKPVYDWVSPFERLWLNQLDRIKSRAERMAKRAANRRQD
mgnify:CR=1 FL=1